MAHDTQCEAELIHGAYTECDCEARHVLALADALARAVEADHGEPDPDCAICQATRAYLAARA